MDRRIQKTQALLRKALISLVHEKPYDSIVVKEILDRANVGRSTFYTHFHDKDELFTSGVQEILRSFTSSVLPPSTKQHERMISFSLPIFEYHESRRCMGESRIGPRGRAVLHEHLQNVLAEMISCDFRKDVIGQQPVAGQIPPDLLAQYIASTFVLVLNWWVESRSPLGPKEVNDLFRGILLPTLTACRQSEPHSNFSL